MNALSLKNDHKTTHQKVTARFRQYPRLETTAQTLNIFLHMLPDEVHQLVGFAWPSFCLSFFPYFTTLLK
jgi:hypothetical protein